MSDPKKFVIIDGNAIIHRAYHAIPPLTSKDGKLVNAVYGFTSMLLKVLADLKPDYIAVSFDVSGPTFRDDLYTEYKAKRVKADQDLYDQIPLVYEVVEAFGIPIFIKQGYEADDVIGTVVTQVQKHTTKSKEPITSIIVTGDKDLLQLVNENKTEVYLLKKGLSEFELYNEAKVNEVFGFGPDCLIDYKALRGDTSDNIPGVKGIGEKTASDLIQTFGSLDEIYKQVKKENHTIKAAVAKKLIDDEDGARMSKILATIETNVPDLNCNVEDATVKPFDEEKLRELFHRFEFVSLLKRLPNTKTETTVAPKKKTKAASAVKRITFETMDALVKLLEKHDSFFCKAILDQGDIFSTPPRGLVFVVDGHSFYLEFGDKKIDILKTLAPIFASEKKEMVGHDLKQLYKVIQLHGVEIKNELFDIMVGSYVINASSRAHDLRSIILRELGTDIGDTTGESTLFGVDPSLIAQEGMHCLEIKETQKKALEETENLGLFRSIEMKLIPVLGRMELYGIAVDVEMLRGLSAKADKTIEKLTKEIWELAGVEFNIASSIQLRDVLFDTLKLPTQGIKKGKTGYSTASPELEKLRELHPIIDLIEEYREVAKLQNTYTDVLPELVNKTTHRIHSSFNQTVAATGRLSSSDPNLQNIPTRTELGREIRCAFISEKGFSLISADYSQIELRIVASLAKDDTMLAIFESGKDIHTATAAAMNNVSEDKVTKDMRNAAKGINFGVLYGMGAYGLSWRTKIPQWQAKEFIEMYFEKFSAVKKYLDTTLEFAKKEGYVETLFGRRRYIPELLSDNYQLRSAGERMAINMPVQGTAADLMKMAMIAVHDEIQKTKAWKDKVRLLLQVHDELVLEVEKGLEDEVTEMLEDAMKNVAQLRVPIDVNVNIGTRWGEMK